MRCEVLLLLLALASAVSIGSADALLRHQHRSASKEGHLLSSKSRTATGDVECPFGDKYTAPSFDKCDVLNDPKVFSKICSDSDEIRTPEESITSIVRWIALKFQENHAAKMNYFDIVKGLKQDCPVVLRRFRKCRVDQHAHGGYTFMRASTQAEELEESEDPKLCIDASADAEDEDETLDREVNKYVKHVVIETLVGNGELVRDPVVQSDLRFARIDFTVANTCEEGWERGQAAFNKVKRALESHEFPQSIVEKCFYRSPIVDASNVDQFTSWFHDLVEQAPITINFGSTVGRALAMAQGLNQADHIKNAFEMLATSSAISFIYTCTIEDMRVAAEPGYTLDCPKEIHYRPLDNYGVRETVENALFGFKSEIGGRRIFDDFAQSCERPVYGALNVLGLPNGAAPGYGTSFFTLKQAVKNRCTFAATDTFFLPGISTPLRRVRPYSYFFDTTQQQMELDQFEESKYHLATLTTTDNLLRDMDFAALDEFATVWKNRGDDFETFDKKKLKYIEVQVLGGVKYSDVESVSLDPAFFPAHSEQRLLMQQWADENGITVHIL